MGRSERRLTDLHIAKPRLLRGRIVSYRRGRFGFHRDHATRHVGIGLAIGIACRPLASAERQSREQIKSVFHDLSLELKPWEKNLSEAFGFPMGSGLAAMERG